MTIEILLQNHVSDLEKMTVPVLTENLKHYFIITRPDEAKKSGPRTFSPGGVTASRNAKLERAKELAKLAGIDLGL